MTKAEMIRALVEAKDYRLTHDEMMRMKKSELAAHIRTSKSFQNVPGKYATMEEYYKAVLNKAKGEDIFCKR